MKEFFFFDPNKKESLPATIRMMGVRTESMERQRHERHGRNNDDENDERVMSTSNFVIRRSKRTECPGFPCHPYSLYLRTRRGAEHGTQFHMIAKEVYDRWAGDTMRRYSRTQHTFHAIVSRVLRANETSAILTPMAEIDVRRMTARLPTTELEQYKAAPRNRWLLMPVGCSMTRTDGHIYLVMSYDDQWFFMDPNGSVRTRRSASPTTFERIRQEPDLEHCRVYDECYRRISSLVKETVEQEVGRKCSNFFQVLSLQREASRWVESRGVCMAIVYWMCLICGLNDNMTAGELKRFIVFRKRQWNSGDQAERMREVIRGVRHQNVTTRDDLDVGGLRLLSHDTNVRAFCEDLVRAQEEHDRQKEMLRDYRFPSYRQVEAYNASVRELSRASRAMQSNMSIEQYIECPRAAKEVVRIAREHADISNLNVPKHMRSEMRAHLLAERLDLNYFETQIVMFIAFAEEFYHEKRKHHVRDNVLRRSSDRIRWLRLES